MPGVRSIDRITPTFVSPVRGRHHVLLARVMFRNSRSVWNVRAIAELGDLCAARGRDDVCAVEAGSRPSRAGRCR